MSLSDRNELFRRSGPQGMLDYLQSKLEAGDLSSEEALALLSALHEELGQGRVADPRMYQAYSRFMDSLRRAMPEVHAYVVSTWGRVRNRREEARDAQGPDEVGESESTARGSGPEAKGGIAEVGIDDGQGSGVGEEFGEAGRTESEGGEEETKAEPIREEAEETEEVEADEAEEEGRKEEENAEPEDVAEREEEVEDAAGEQPEQEGREEAEQAERDAGESESRDEAEAAEAKPESVEAEPETEGGRQAETEWPQMEEPGEEEPIEGEEGGPANPEG